MAMLYPGQGLGALTPEQASALGGISGGYDRASQQPYDQRQRHHEAMMHQRRIEEQLLGRGISPMPGFDAPPPRMPKKPKTIRQELQEEVNDWLKDSI